MEPAPEDVVLLTKEEFLFLTKIVLESSSGRRDWTKKLLIKKMGRCPSVLTGNAAIQCQEHVGHSGNHLHKDLPKLYASWVD